MHRDSYVRSTTRFVQQLLPKQQIISDSHQTQRTHTPHSYFFCLAPDPLEFEF